MTAPPESRSEPRDPPAWHTLALPAVFGQLDSSAEGLSQQEAQARLARNGPNRLPEQPPPSLLQIVARQFRSPLIYILAVAAVVSLFLQEYNDAGFIAAVLAINALIGAVQEWRAEQSSQALKKLLQIRATVERDGDVREVAAEEVVPGDLVWLESGARVPADLRLVSVHGLEIDESLLTGESAPVLKDPHWSGDEATPMADRLNMAFAGSICAHGRGKGIVVATGPATAVGQLALDVLASPGGKTPLIDRMEKFSEVIAVAVLVLAGGIGALGWWLGQYDLPYMFMFVVALAVSAIPEGLPVAMTVALSLATTRMARRGVIVRRLTAVEGLGSCTLIATDKTGTLTANELMVERIYLPGGEKFEVTGEGFVPHGQVLRDGQPMQPGKLPALDRLARAGVLCNESELHAQDGSWTWRGDAVDIALLSMAHKLGMVREPLLGHYPQTNQIPFEPERQYAATFHETDGRITAFVKGAPERLLGMCAGSEDPAVVKEVERAAVAMAREGFRVLALAEGEAPADLSLGSTPAEPSGLSLLGLVGMIDPLRPGVREAVEMCHAAGISVAMITGDHRITALAIARDLGMAEDESQVVVGSQLLEKTPQELAELIERGRVFARVAPRQKLQIVEAARAAGHYVAVTGDGVNDAPALRAANIGVAMGRSGTDVAREAAELVLSDDNFATIVAGVEEGRVAFDNVRKVIYLLISTGAAELALVLLTVVAGLPLPLLPVQLLWLNLVTNGIQGVALAFEPSEGDVLHRKPRSPREPIFNRLMIERTAVAVVVMGLVGFATFYWLTQYRGWSVEQARNGLLLLMVLFENVHIGNCRSETKSAFSLSPLRSPFLLVGAISALLVHVGSMYVPLGHRVLGTAPIPAADWLLFVLLALTILPAMEIHKWMWRARQPS